MEIIISWASGSRHNKHLVNCSFVVPFYYEILFIDSEFNFYILIIKEF